MTAAQRAQRAETPRRPREVGVVTGLSARGLLTVRGAGAVAEGTPVLDEEGRFHGKVVRVFGPVARPYIAVAPRRPLRSEDALALVGQRILTEVPRHGP